VTLHDALSRHVRATHVEAPQHESAMGPCDRSACYVSDLEERRTNWERSRSTHHFVASWASAVRLCFGSHCQRRPAFKGLFLLGARWPSFIDALMHAQRSPTGSCLGSADRPTYQGDPTMSMTVNVQLGFGDWLSAKDVLDCAHSVHNSLRSLAIRRGSPLHKRQRSPRVVAAGDRSVTVAMSRIGCRDRQQIFSHPMITMTCRAGDRTRTGDVQLGKVTGLQVHSSLYHGTRPEDAQTSPLQNGRSGLKNGLGGPSVDPTFMLRDT
jgi:hypothetical protein